MSDYTIELKGDDISKWELAKAAKAEVIAKADEVQQDKVSEATYDTMTRFKCMVTDADAFTVLGLKDNLLDELERIQSQGLFMQFVEDQAREQASQIYQGLDRAEESLSPIPDEIQVEEQVHEQRVEALREALKPAKAKPYKPSKPRFNKISNTSNPTLTRAVIRQLGGGSEAKENLIDVNNHGADAGFCNFVYYKDTVPFFERQRAAILRLLEADGEDPASIVMQFRCLNLSKSDREEWRTYQGAVNRLLYGNRKVDWDKQEEVFVANSLAWFALEEVAREMVIE